MAQATLRSSAKLGKSSPVIFGCIDIGSNTTRLLVAEPGGGDLRELASERVFTCIRKSLNANGVIPATKVEETAAVAGAQAERARALGAQEIFAVATAAIRNAANRRELERAVEERVGVPLRVLSPAEEARLSFAGATSALPSACDGTVAVIDVGGGSTELASGLPQGEVEWWQSLPIGSGVLADRYLDSDPPTAAQLETVRRHVDEAFQDLVAPPVSRAVAVGGTATSLLRVLGGALDAERLERAVGMLSEAPVEALAARLELDPERLRVLPAGILVLRAAAEALHRPLEIACGGLREGVILARAEGRA